MASKAFTLETLPDRDAPLAIIPGLGNRLPSMKSLPPEIRRQVLHGRGDMLRESITRLMDEKFDGIASVSEVWLALWHEDPSYSQRRVIASKMERMRSLGHLYHYGTMRGIFMTPDRFAAGRAKITPIKKGGK